MAKGIYPRESLIHRFWRKVDKKDVNSCWEWKASKTPKGYGQLVNNKKRMLAHRYSYEIHNRPPGKMCVCHSCDNPGCVNPFHLFLGTNKENTEDMINKGRKPIGENHISSKLTGSDIEEIRKSTLKQIDIAEKYGVHQTQISNIKNRKQWKHI